MGWEGEGGRGGVGDGGGREGGEVGRGREQAQATVSHMSRKWLNLSLDVVVCHVEATPTSEVMCA